MLDFQETNGVAPPYIRAVIITTRILTRQSAEGTACRACWYPCCQVSFDWSALFISLRIQHLFPPSSDIFLLHNVLTSLHCSATSLAAASLKSVEHNIPRKWISCLRWRIYLHNNKKEQSELEKGRLEPGTLRTTCLTSFSVSAWGNTRSVYGKLRINH